jgi:DNA-3-methyladenine glycosylase I
MIELIRCPWAEQSEEERLYHDEEWGVPVRDDRRHFEFLLLEAMQAGLSWRTILRKREGFRAAFADFDPQRVARFDEADEKRLLADAAIIRNGRKIRAAIGNARAFLGVQEDFGSFDAYIWRFVDGSPIQNRFETEAQVPATTPLSEAVSKDLKARGFTFVGPTVIYAHMQATGLVNDHLMSCFRHEQVVDLAGTM